VLGTSQWPVLRLHVQRIADAVNAVTPGSYTEVTLPEVVASFTVRKSASN
jgi:hypothetical protein